MTKYQPCFLNTSNQQSFQGQHNKDYHKQSLTFHLFDRYLTIQNQLFLYSYSNPATDFLALNLYELFHDEYANILFHLIIVTEIHNFHIHLVSFSILYNRIIHLLMRIPLLNITPILFLLDQVIE